MLEAAEFKAFQDHLSHYCIDKATEYNLPVKLHTGYYGGMPLTDCTTTPGTCAPCSLPTRIPPL